MSSEKILTPLEAYIAMFSFLDEYYKRTGSDDVGSLLSGMSLMKDGEPMDKGYMAEWKEAISKALDSKVDINMQLFKEEKS